MAEQSTSSDAGSSSSPAPKSTTKGGKAPESEFVVNGVAPDPLTAMIPAEPDGEDAERRVQLVPVDWTVSTVAFPDPLVKPDAAGYVPTVQVTEAGNPRLAPFYVAEADVDQYLEAAARHGVAIQKVSI